MRVCTVGDLIRDLEKIPEDYIVRVSVAYDDCEHIQYLNTIYTFKGCGNGWVTLSGVKDE